MTARLLSRLDNLEPEDGFGPNLKEVQKLTKQLGELERKLTNNYGVAKKEVDKGRDAMEADDAEIDEKEIVHQWAVLEAYLNACLDDTKAELKTARVSHAKAKQAFSAGDAKALLGARTELQALDVMKQPSKDLKAKEAELWKTFDPKKLSKSLQQQLGRDRTKFEKIIKELVQLETEAAKLLKEVLPLRVKAVDHKKAATVLKIPKTHVAKLQKALALDAARRPKALDALAKELKLKTKSKDMLLALKKAKVL